MEKAIKCTGGYVILKSREEIKRYYDKLMERYFAIMREKDEIKDIIDQLRGLVEYEN